jgi:hypothetical protein
MTELLNVVLLLLFGLVNAITIYYRNQPKKSSIIYKLEAIYFFSQSRQGAIQFRLMDRHACHIFCLPRDDAPAMSLRNDCMSGPPEAESNPFPFANKSLGVSGPL